MNDVEQIAESTPAPPAVVDNQEPAAEATGAAVAEAPKANTPESAFEALRAKDGFSKVGKPEAKADKPDAEAAATDMAPKSDPPPETKPKATAPKTGETRKVELAAEIGDALKERRKLTVEIDQLRAQKRALEAQPANGNQPAPHAGKSAPAANGKPVAPDLEAISKEVGEEKAWAEYQRRQADYTEALTDWKLEQRQQAAKANEVAEMSNKRIASAVARHGDFEEVVLNNEQLAMTTFTAGILHDMGDVGDDIAYYLGKNPAEDKRISRLSVSGQAEAITELKQKLSKSAPVNGAGRQVSKASPPPEEVRSTTQTPLDPAKAALAKGNFGEFRRIEREKREAALKPR